LLHGDLSVPIVLIYWYTDDDNWPLQTLRLVHRRHEHCVMGRRLLIRSGRLGEVLEQPCWSDRRTRLFRSVRIFTGDLAQGIKRWQTVLRCRPRFDPLRQVEGIDD